MSNPRIAFELASSRPRIAPPAGGSLIVQVVVNVENWPFDRAMPRTILPPPHGAAPLPDVPNFSWAEYGMRCGLPRLLELFADRGIPTVASMNAAVIEVYPRAAEAMLKAGWEFMGHGLRQATLHNEPDEFQAIAETRARIQAFSGAAPRGWLGPGLQETVNTPDLLKQAGFDFVCDWVLDDLPAVIATETGPLVAIPYGLDLNDSVIYAVERHATGEYLNRAAATVKRFIREIKVSGPRVLTLALHPHLMGVPHRIAELEAILDLLGTTNEVTFMTGAEICDWYTASAEGAA
jgi:peptidoglycan/xylan/chitin deacetylase (PgdA/CDA1 family)